MKTQITTDWQAAAEWIKRGEVVGIPTETVYGLAGNGLNIDAVLRIFEVKNRPFFDPLILHTDSVESAAAFVAPMSVRVKALFEAFSPGPLTVLLPKNEKVPDLVTSGLPTVAVRIPHHRLTLDLLKNLDFPLAAPSANPFGYISPTTAAHVAAQLSGKIPMILDGGACQIGVESTIVGFENDQPIVYRLGGLAVEALEEVLGKVILNVNQSSDPKSPGQLKSHYAPKKPFFVVENMEQKLREMAIKNVGLIRFQDVSDKVSPENQVVLSHAGDVREAAKKLFAAMRFLDSRPDIDIIVAEWLPDIGLGRALNDRLRRAQFQNAV